MSNRAAIISAAISLTAIATIASAPAHATDYATPDSGISGGNPYGMVCPQGQRLAGVGLLIDAGPQTVQNLRPACVPVGFGTRWTGQRVIIPVNATQNPSNQQINDQLFCPADTVVNAVAPLLSDAPSRITGLRLTCRGSGNVRQTVEKAPAFNLAFRVGRNVACRSVDWGQGLWGAAESEMLNRVGLICAENPILQPPTARRPDTELQRPGSLSGSTGRSP